MPTGQIFTLDLIRVLDGISVPKGFWLVIVDVEALYNLIPNECMVQVVKGFIFEHGTTAGPYN